MRKPKFEMFKDVAGEWRWRLKAPNGKIIADSGEGYKTRVGCFNGIESMQMNAPKARIVIE